MQKTTKTYTIREEKELDDIDISLTPGDRVFFVGDLGAGKSTMIRRILRKYMNDPTLVVRSPTYTYYQRYTSSPQPSPKGEGAHVPFPFSEGEGARGGGAIYHMDLYRLEDYDTWVSIGGEEIAEDPTTIMLIEWPEILGDAVQYTKKVSIELMETEERKIIYEEHL